MEGPGKENEIETRGISTILWTTNIKRSMVSVIGEKGRRYQLVRDGKEEEDD